MALALMEVATDWALVPISAHLVATSPFGRPLSGMGPQSNPRSGPPSIAGISIAGIPWAYWPLHYA